MADENNSPHDKSYDEVTFFTAVLPTTSVWKAPATCDDSLFCSCEIEKHIITQATVIKQYKPKDLKDYIRSAMTGDGAPAQVATRRSSKSRRKLLEVDEMLEQLSHCVHVCIDRRDDVPTRYIDAILHAMIEICVEFKVADAQYMEYALGTLMGLPGLKYTNHFLLQQYTGYTANCNMENLEYFLEQTKRMRFEVKCFSEPLPSNEKSASKEQEHEKRRCCTYRVNFLDYPSSIDDVSGIQDPLGYVVVNLYEQVRFKRSPDVVLLLLRYGARPRPNPACEFRLTMFYPAMTCAANVNFEMEHEYVDLPMENTYEQVVNDKRVIQPMTSLRYMLRADPYISIEYQERYIWNDQVPADEWNETTCYPGDYPKSNALELDHRLRDRFLPQCLTESIPSLLRFSRYVIRCVLLQNTQLPGGIKQLPVTEHLKPYLDLLVD